VSPDATRQSCDHSQKPLHTCVPLGEPFSFRTTFGSTPIPGAGRNPRLYAQNGLLAIQRGRFQGETPASEIAEPGGIAEAAVRGRGPSRGGMAPPMRDPSPSRLRPMPSHRFWHTLRRKGPVARSCGKISGNRAQKLRRQLRQLHSRVSNGSTEWRVPELSRRGRWSFQKRHAILAATRSPTAEVE
jgi:hypothetical protein